ncbi:MAG: protein arginine kinase [Firmicutes bacterium]|nr:protein arginine kinase [Alicyclobacillaceae bacterium]MCL6498369.1 protein arginine kinase [Bacillota bacterium]
MNPEFGRFSRWMEGKGPDSDIVLSARVRLARNLRQLPFPHRLDEGQAETTLARLQETFAALEEGWHLRFHRLAEVAPLDRQVLVEKHLISPQLVQEPVRFQAVAIDPGESISIMINEEDHLRIQVVLPALSLNEAWQVADRLDDALEEHLDFAFDARWGYLTACPTNLGTGMRASVMVHLPGLVLTRQVAQVFTTLSQVGMVARGLYGEGTDALGNIFQISNQVSLGLSEEEFLHNLAVVAQQIVGSERHARQHLRQEAGIRLADRVARAYGILTHAKILTSEEALRLLSEVKLGADLGIVPAPSRASFAQLAVLTQPGFLQLRAGRALSPLERDELRARLIREQLVGEAA